MTACTERQLAARAYGLGGEGQKGMRQTAGRGCGLVSRA